MLGAIEDILENDIVIRHDVSLVKITKRKTPDDLLDEQVKSVLARIETPGRITKGWKFEWDGKVTDDLSERAGASTRARGKAQIHNYRVTFSIRCELKRPRAGIDGEFQNIVSQLVAASNRHPFFQVVSVDGQAVEEVVTDAAGIKSSGADDFVGYAPFILPADAREMFGHIYGREAQIGIVMSAIEAALDSDWTNRFHCVLMGPPACGKTEILTTIKRIVGKESVLVFDGTSTTQAGAQKEFMEREELPRILVIEEIEKTDEAALRYLLGLLDDRGEIRKQTAREKIVRDARVLCLATANDIDRLKVMLSGALWSRFRHQVYCPRPDRDLMHKILTREVDKASVDGPQRTHNRRWIAPTLDYLDKLGSSDPRQGIALCLSGRDGWLDGTYPDMLEQVRRIGEKLTNAEK